MENSKIFKRLVIVMLSLVLVAVCSTSVFAADDDLFLSVNSTGNTASNATDNNTTTSDNSTTNNTVANNVTTNNTTNSSLTTNNTTINNTTRNTAVNNTTNNTSNTNSNVNTLAKTGLSNTNGIVALVLVVCGVSAIYSYKKVNDYKKL